MEPLIHLKSQKLYFKGRELDNPGLIDVPRGLTAVVGPNGSGKTTLAHILSQGWNFRTNRISSPLGRMSVKLLEFNDIHSLSGCSASYYQQRYESSMNDDVPTVGQVMGQRLSSPLWAEMSTRLGLSDVATKKLNYLSSGELRKLLIINALSDAPDLLILDNPHAGLDAPSRRVLDDALASLAQSGVNLIVNLANPADIPAATSTVIPMSGNRIHEPMPAGGGAAGCLDSIFDSIFAGGTAGGSLPDPAPRADSPASTVVDFAGCAVRYGRRVIIDGVDWVVSRGQHWALSGPNGAGKSTLLSLIHADNPQGYSNAITLFDRRRGSGETIWEIKRRIGYVSPEMHLYFNGGGDVATIVANGLNDTVGLYVKPRPWQIALAGQWLETMGISHLADRRFNTLSAGEQRLTLLTRALVKRPELLILDEPLHGLDARRREAAREVIGRVAADGTDPVAMIYVTHYLDETPRCVSLTKTLAGRGSLL